MKKHIWKFTKFGGVTQLILETGEDILHLKELDQKIWTVLAMPTEGIFFDKETAKLLDTDGDGFIRPPEILNAINFLDESLNDISVIMREGENLTTADIKDAKLLHSADWCLHKLGLESKTFSLADINTQQEALLNSRETEELSDDDSVEVRLKKVLRALVRENPDSEASEVLKAFYAEKEQYLKWAADLGSKCYGLMLEQIEPCIKAFEAVQKKIDDFFVRCKLLEYDEFSKEALTDYNETFKSCTQLELDEASEVLQTLPVAMPRLEKVLDLQQKLNPAWITRMRDFYAQTIIPIAGELHIITENDWKNISEKVKEIKAFYETKYDLKLSHLGMSILQNVGASDGELEEIINEAIVFEKQKTNIQGLKKLLLFRKHFFTLLKNYVSFSDFYSGEGSLFQAGVLFFDTRSAHLCFELSDDERHGSLDILSGAYLLYCTISRGTEKRKILALLTNGLSDTVVVGRNGIFYDRDGKDWNATVTKVLSNPISVREAFFSPYKNLARMIEDQIAKKAGASEEKATALLSNVADKAVNAPKEAAQSIPSKKIDLGTIALIGTTVGGVSTLIGSILQALFGLGYWVPVGLIGLVLIVSGPSMVLAAMKLRKRSIAPILEANGWAINAHAKVNIPLGESLTKLLLLPKNSRLMGFDPFAEKKKGKRIFIALLVLILVLAGVFCYFAFIKKLGVNPMMWFNGNNH